MMPATIKLILAALAMSSMIRGGKGQWAGDSTTQDRVQILEPNPIKCLCSDAAPRASIYYNVSYTCLQQLTFGSCNTDFMRNSQIATLPEGWCQVTCGRCSCCKTVSQVLAAQNLTSLAAAARLASLEQQLASPASMFTLLAPNNDAFAQALKTLGAASLEAIPSSKLEAIVKYHIIPPHAGINAVWTTPFFAASDGNLIPTVVSSASLRFSGSATNVTVKGASNSANIITPDIEACKSFVDIIDAVLLPPDGASAAPLPSNAGNINQNFGPAPSVAQQQAAVSSPTDGEIETAGK